MFLLGGVTFGGTFLIAWIIVTYNRWRKYHGPIAAGLARGAFHPNNIQFDLKPELEQRMRSLSHTQNNNLLVYSGYSPFVGSGLDIGGWSLPLNLSRGKMQQGKRLSPEPFTVKELYHYCSERIANVGISNLKIEDKICVNGQEIRDDRRFLSHPYGQPYQQISPDQIRELLERPTQNIRYYKCFQVESWGGELICSIYLRFSRLGKNLFVEANYRLLTPVNEAYHKIDHVEASFRLRSALIVALQSFLPALLLWIFSPFLLLTRPVLAFARWRVKRRIHREITENPAFDYGALSSLREAVSSKAYHRHFQKLDKEMYLKILENQMLESIVDFLDMKNIDTTELKERQEVILNNGVIISGGEFKAGNVAIGERAKAITSSIVRSTLHTASGNV